MQGKDKVDALLEELGLVPSKSVSNKQAKAAGESPAAVDVLAELLRTNAVSSEAVRKAHATISGRKSDREEVKVPANSTDDKTDTKTAAKEVSSTPQPQPQYRTRHIAMRVYYDGSSYSGLAQNMGHEDDNSIERALFEALQKTHLVIDRASSGYSRCGRTDRGVSAAGQVVALKYLKSNVPLDATWDQEGTRPVEQHELPKNENESVTVWVRPKQGKKKQQQDPASSPRVQKQISELPYARMLNNVLPLDIRILGWCPVSDDFSARFSCSTRTYRYFFVRRQLNLDRMRQGLQLMVGSHDFRNFCKMDVEKVYNFERTIHEAKIVESNDESSPAAAYNDVCYFEIHGQAFLWHQIRCIVSVLFLIGQGLEEPSVVSELLDVTNNPGKPSYALAAEQPLVLHDCGYPNLQLGHSAQNLFTISCLFEQQWEELIIAAARIRNGMDRLRDAAVLRSDVVDFVSRKLQERIKKQGKHRVVNDSQSLLDRLEDGLSPEPVLSWGDAVEWMSSLDFRPDPQSLKEVVHIPLLQRSKGPTYEEKIESLCQGSSKRRQKYEDNVIKKRKTTEEDAAFYKHMMKQGGSGV